MAEAVELPLGAGTAVVFSMRCPGVEGPNEDSAAVIGLGERRAVLIVADGLGGRPGGESASEIVVRTLGTRVRRVAAGGGSVRTAILDSLEEANATIIGLGIGAGTTAAIVEIEGPLMRAYHVGDSGIVAVGQRGRVKFQTVSHSPTAYAVESGLLDAEEALRHEDRHLVSNVVGARDMRIEIGSWVRLAARDTVLLATDGVFDNLRLQEILGIVRTGSLDDAGRRMIRACTRRMTRQGSGAPSKPDDLTFVLYRPQHTAPSLVRR
jgi:PPM family protein phosphatase